jgi:hypothetical protein
VGSGGEFCAGSETTWDKKDLIGEQNQANFPASGTPFGDGQFRPGLLIVAAEFG